MNISKQEIEKRKKLARDAEIIASLDNPAKPSKEYLEMERKWIHGEITEKEFDSFVFSKNR